MLANMISLHITELVLFFVLQYQVVTLPSGSDLVIYPFPPLGLP